MHWLHSNSRRVLVFTVGALIALSGIAYATIPDISGLISAWYSSTSGALRVIDSAAKCSAAERALSWNQTGPAGPQGLKGATGAAGAQGPKGDAGAAGPQGPQGAKGDAGTAGAQGATGDPGGAGPQGPQGAKGDTGATGAQGLKGDTGATGAQGLKGDAGPNNVAGTYGDTVTFSNQANVFSGSFAGTFHGDGAGLTGLNANSIASGVISVSRLPAGVLYQSTYARVNPDGTFDGSAHSGILAVQRFQAGVYCVVPVSTINLQTTAAVATLSNDLGLILVSAGAGCSIFVQNVLTPAIAVNTYDLTGRHADYAFQIVVP